MNTRDRALLDQVEQIRTTMNAQLDAIIAQIEGDTTPSASPRRRTSMRSSAAGAVLITTDIAKAKARAALARMGAGRVAR